MQRGVAEKASGPVWQNVASTERGGMAGKRHSGVKGRQKKKPSSQKQLSMTIRGQTTGEEEDPEQRDPAALTMHELDVQFVSWCLLPAEICFDSSSTSEDGKALTKNTEN